jgi:hypothetical protein
LCRGLGTGSVGIGFTIAMVYKPSARFTVAPVGT